MRANLWGAVLLSTLLWTSSAAAVTPDYYPLPAGHSISNFGVASDGAGNVWFAVQAPPPAPGPQVASLARLNVATATPGTSNGMTFFPTPDPPVPSCCATQVRSVGFSRTENRVYYVRSEGSYGFGNPAAMAPGTTLGFTSGHLPGYQDLADLAIDPTGGIWFSERSSSNVAPDFYGGRIASWDGTGAAPIEGPNIAIQNGNVALNSQRYDARPSGIAVTPLGQPWFVQENPGLPGYRIATYTGGNSYQEYLAAPCQPTEPCSGSYTGTGLSDVALAPDGGVWFTNELKKTFGRFDPVTLDIQQYAIASVDPTLASGTPRRLTTAPDGTIWMTVFGGYTNNAANALVRIVPTTTPAATVYKVDPNAPPLGLGADTSGNMWFGLASPSPPGKLGRLAGVVGPAPGGSGAPGTPAAVPGPAPSPSPSPSVPLVAVSTGKASLTPPQVGNGAINTNQICAGPPQAKCSIIYLIKEREYVAGFPGAGGSAAAKKRKPKPRIIGKKTVTLSGGQSQKVTVTLNALGKRILRKKKKLNVVFTATEQLAGGRTKVITKRSLVMRRR